MHRIFRENKMKFIYMQSERDWEKNWHDTKWNWLQDQNHLI